MEIKVTRKKDDYPHDEFEGFTKLYELEWKNNSYEFDITGVWRRDSDRTVWFANDGGCSCPCPWEGTDTLERVFSIEPFEERRRNLDQDYGTLRQNEWDEFQSVVEKALSEL